MGTVCLVGESTQSSAETKRVSPNDLVVPEWESGRSKRNTKQGAGEMLDNIPSPPQPLPSHHPHLSQRGNNSRGGGFGAGALKYSLFFPDFLNISLYTALIQLFLHFFPCSSFWKTNGIDEKKKNIKPSLELLHQVMEKGFLGNVCSQEQLSAGIPVRGSRILAPCSCSLPVLHLSCWKHRQSHAGKGIFGSHGKKNPSKQHNPILFQGTETWES